MTKARQLADLGNAYDDGAITGSNMVTNGSMQVAQRGTSQTNSSYGSVDRWYIYSSGGTFTQETSSPPEGFSHYLTCTSATGSVIVSQAIELPATGSAGVFYNGQTITISYYAKSTSAGDALYNPISFRNGVTSITNLVSVESDSSDTNVLTTSWARYSKTYTIGVNLNSNNTCLVIQPRTSGAPSGDISITGVQLEVGDTATPFEHRSYGDELAKCKRYFEKQTGLASCEQGVVSKVVSTREHVQKWEVTKRATPSVTFSTNGYYIYANHAIDTGTSTGVQFATVHSALLSTLGCTGRTAGETVAVEHCIFEADAEL